MDFINTGHPFALLVICFTINFTVHMCTCGLQRVLHPSHHTKAV